VWRSLCSASYDCWQRGATRIRPAHAALLCAVQQSIDISCRPGPQQQTCSSGQMDRCTDPALHNIQAVLVNKLMCCVCRIRWWLVKHCNANSTDQRVWSAYLTASLLTYLLLAYVLTHITRYHYALAYHWKAVLHKQLWLIYFCSVYRVGQKSRASDSWP